MKHFTTATFCLMAFVSLSCSTKEKDDGVPIQKSASGSSEITVTEDFDGIKVSTGIDAEVVKSDVEKAVVTGPSSSLDKVEAKVIDGILTVRIKPGILFKNISGIKAKIFAKDFSSIEASSGATINVKDKFLQDKMDISVSSAGGIQGNLEANDMNIDASSSGSFTGKIWAVNLSSDASSAGAVSVSGNTKKLTASTSSGGSWSGKELTAENANLDASSGGSVTAGVTTILTADASSGGNVNYFLRGNLKEKNVDESSGGVIQEVK